MENEIFISYSTLDEDVANRVLEHIEGNGYDCFLAKRDIGGGTQYASKLVDAISNCEIVVLIASENSNKSDHVLNEIDLCVEKKKTIIPFVIEDFNMCDEFRYYLGRSQRIVAFGEDPEAALPRLLDSIKIKYPLQNETKNSKVEEDTIAGHSHKQTIFEYDVNRGIMINPEDRMRNVSFRQDTFLEMMKGIFEEVELLAGVDEAMAVFFQCGYSGGGNFGARLNHTCENSNLTLSEKLDKWCEFDSQVGWGKFSSNITLDEEEGTLDGTFSINECFFIDKKHEKNVCSYIRGYCTGVIEALLGNINVEITCRVCPVKNKFKSECVFEVQMKKEI